MRILAVIPARAGSKGIPNKNIRMVGAHPLVYYAIHNALLSENITDIVVTTDSTEVRLIAQQMGVQCRWRSEDLCRDETTLDSVIFDAIPGGETYDYVVTMQPTSPTLRRRTLDAAIDYAISNDLETVISVVNDPHLAWKLENGKAVPAYEQRLNRQYLPAYYKETGAFVISKFTSVSSSSRIGKRVGVFEVPEDESQDVDTFADLLSVTASMERRKVAIFVNGNNKTGMGHIYRALELADEFYSKPDIIYNSEETKGNAFGTTKHCLLPIRKKEELYEICSTKQYDLFINDVLDTDLVHMKNLRAAMPNARIVNFEDSGEGSSIADLVINALYGYDIRHHVLTGENYFIAAKSFLFYRPIPIREKVKTVMLTFGGADPQNYSDRLLKIITKAEYSDYSFIVVLGRAKKDADALCSMNYGSNIEIYHNVENMPELMSLCDIALTSRGRTGYELALLGIPTIAMAQNEREEKHVFMSSENGFTYLGLNPSDIIIESNLKLYLSLPQHERKELQKKLLSHDLRQGRKRVMNAINSIL